VPIAVQSEVEPVLGVFAKRLRAVLDRAMEDWLAIPNRGQFVYPRTRANIIFDHIIRHALIEFDGDGENTVKALPEPQSVKFLFQSSVVARFKKGNARGVGANIETQAVLDYIDPQASFDGLPSIHRVEIVYQLNILGTGYAEVAVVARDKRTRIWSYPLTGRPSADIIPITPRTPPVLTPPAVTPKPRADEKSDEENPDK
jgi:hypothetical protein